MKRILLTTIAAVLLVGCAKPPPPDISIHQAAKDGNIEAVKQHLAAGTDVNAKMLDGRTPLDWASGGYEGEPPEDKVARKEIADLLRKHGGKHGTIHTAAKAGDAEAVKEFLAAGTDVNAKDDSGWTPLPFATTKEIAKLLIAEGADVNTKDENSLTPLDLAIQNQGSVMYPGRQEETAALLRKHGAKTGEELKAEGK